MRAVDHGALPAIAAELVAEATRPAPPTRAPHLRLISNPASTGTSYV